MSDYSGRIMNIQTDKMGATLDKEPLIGRDVRLAYKLGHRDARHEAAEIAIEAELEIVGLKSTLYTKENP